MQHSETESVRLDKWLWFARFYRTRSMASARIQKGVRINGNRITKPAYSVRIGDTLTFSHGNRIRIVEILALAERRGSAKDARELYRELES